MQENALNHPFKEVMRKTLTFGSIMSSPSLITIKS